MDRRGIRAKRPVYNLRGAIRGPISYRELKGTALGELQRAMQTITRCPEIDLRPATVRPDRVSVSRELRARSVLYRRDDRTGDRTLLDASENL